MKYYSFFYVLTFLLVSNVIFCSVCIENAIPFVYSPVYNTNINPMIEIAKNALQIQKNRSVSDDEAKKELDHVFHLSKYQDITDKLGNDKIFNVDSLIIPEEPSQDILLKVHAQDYLEKIKEPVNISIISNKPYIAPILNTTPIEKLDDVILKPQRYATSGTVLAANIALKTKCCAINLGGGFHHCDGRRCTNISCFCFYADIPQAIIEILSLYPNEKILVVDFDAHSGNGINYWLGQNQQYQHKVVIFDVCNAQAFPLVETVDTNNNKLCDEFAGKYTRYYRPIGKQGGMINGNSFAQNIYDDLYLNTIKELEEIIGKENPTLIIYNAGTDILEGDTAGDMYVTAQGVIERDEYVFTIAKKNNIPVVMTLAGGYKRKGKGYVSFEETSEKAGSTEVVIESIKNLVKRGFINTKPGDILIDKEIVEHYLDKNLNKIVEKSDAIIKKTTSAQSNARQNSTNFQNSLNDLAQKTGKTSDEVKKKLVNKIKNKILEKEDDFTFSTRQKIFIGSCLVVFAFIFTYCLKYNINPITAVLQLLKQSPEIERKNQSNESQK